MQKKGSNPPQRPILAHEKVRPSASQKSVQPKKGPVFGSKPAIAQTKKPAAMPQPSPGALRAKNRPGSTAISRPTGPLSPRISPSKTRTKVAQLKRGHIHTAIYSIDSVPTPERPRVQTSGVVQRTWIYSATRSITGKTRTVYYHTSFDDTDITSLHITFADTEVYDNRSWAIRCSYTPTSRRIGTWTAPAVNLGNELSLNQQGIFTLIQSKISIAQSQALADFHGDPDIVNLLNTAFPPPAPPVVVPSRWGIGASLATIVKQQEKKT